MCPVSDGKEKPAEGRESKMAVWQIDNLSSAGLFAEGDRCQGGCWSFHIAARVILARRLSKVNGPTLQGDWPGHLSKMCLESPGALEAHGRNPEEPRAQDKCRNPLLCTLKRSPGPLKTLSVAAVKFTSVKTAKPL